MNSLWKTTASGLIIVLASFAGGVCLMPMPLQAMTMERPGGPALADENTEISSPSGASSSHGAEGELLLSGISEVTGDDHSVTAWNLCAVKCASPSGEAIAAKKFSVDGGPSFFAESASNQPSHFFMFSSGATDLTGTHSPFPDTLSSVFKKE